jgi:colicin import membrane protein
MSSLAELRAIEDERVAAERSAVAAAEEARVRDRELSEQRVREREAQRLAAERDAALALERARGDAERELRLRVEAAEAAERGRHQAVLDDRRLTAELEMRRAEVARKRPTWMVAVTSCAVVAAIASSAFAVDRHRAVGMANEHKQVSDLARQEAREDARHAIAELVKVQAALASLEGRVASAIEDVRKAQHAQDLAAAAAKLKRLADEDAQIKRAAAAAQRETDKALRNAPIVIDQECRRNAWSKKCPN